MPILLTNSQGKEDTRHAEDLKELLLPRFQTTCLHLQKPLDPCISINTSVELLTHTLPCPWRV